MSQYNLNINFLVQEGKSNDLLQIMKTGLTGESQG